MSNRDECPEAVVVWMLGALATVAVIALWFLAD